MKFDRLNVEWIVNFIFHQMFLLYSSYKIAIISKHSNKAVINNLWQQSIDHMSVNDTCKKL